jgi:hypothetical protein
MARANRQIGNQLPLDPFSVLRAASLYGMDHSENEGRIPLLLSNGRKDLNSAIFHLEESVVPIAIVVPNIDAVQAFDPHPVHFIGNGVISVPSQSINARPHDKMCPDVLSGAKELINIAFAIADMDTPRWITDEARGLPEIVQPSDALLLFHRDPRQVDPLLESSCSLELLSRPKFDRS